jgi:hypothetical protein
LARQQLGERYRHARARWISGKAVANQLAYDDALPRS